MISSTCKLTGTDAVVIGLPVVAQAIVAQGVVEFQSSPIGRIGIRVQGASGGIGLSGGGGVGLGSSDGPGLSSGGGVGLGSSDGPGLSSGIGIGLSSGGGTVGLSSGGIRASGSGVGTGKGCIAGLGSGGGIVCGYLVGNCEIEKSNAGQHNE